MEILIKFNNDRNGNNNILDNVIKEKSLLELLRDQNIFLDSYCGGSNSKCGKCKIKIKDLNFSLTDQDKLHLSKKEIEDGYRLACNIYPKEDIIIIYEGNYPKCNELQNYTILSEFFKKKEIENPKFRKGYGIAVDIGTTTIVMRVSKMSDGSFIAEDKVLNPQIIYGCDVITRISNSKDHLFHMQKQIVNSINLLFRNLILKHSLFRDSLINNSIFNKEYFSFVISGNTTMMHILNGFSLESLGVFPFTPITLEYKIENPKSLISDLNQGEIKIIPGISTFVGGDILSGIYYTELYKNEKVSILIDLGTNGEIAIGNKDKIIVTSTAAGPAFEGGNIQCGIGSIKGAICGAEYAHGNFIFKTINGSLAKGICGTGIIDIMSIFSTEKLIDETGRFSADNCHRINLIGDEIFITQKDIREFQLAKSAIRTGIELAIESFGINKNEIETIYLAGGFGATVNLNSFFNLGIIPKELENKVVIAGNTSLAGAIKAIYDSDYEVEVEKIKQISSELNLAENENFNDYFAEYMFF